MSNTITSKERAEVVCHHLGKLGFTRKECQQLRRIASTLQNWFEYESGIEQGRVKKSIERDENEKPFLRVQYRDGGGKWVDDRIAIPDRESGAIKRLDTLMGRFPKLVACVQGDCKGASVYILRRSDIQEGVSINAIYHLGTAVY